MIHTCVIVRAKDSNKKNTENISPYANFFFCFLAGSHKVNTHLVGNHFYSKKCVYVFHCFFMWQKIFKKIFFLSH